MYNPRPRPFDVNLGPRQRFRGDETPRPRRRVGDGETTHRQTPSQETHFEDMFDDDFDLDAEEPESPCGVTAFDVERASRRISSSRVEDGHDALCGFRGARSSEGLHRGGDDGAVRRPRGLNLARSSWPLAR